MWYSPSSVWVTEFSSGMKDGARMTGYTMFLNFTSIPKHTHNDWMNTWMNAWMNEWKYIRVRDRLTHFSVSHHHSGVGMFPFQAQNLFQGVGLQPRRTVTTETQRTRPLTFAERLGRRKEGGWSCTESKNMCFMSVCSDFTSHLKHCILLYADDILVYMGEVNYS